MFLPDSCAGVEAGLRAGRVRVVGAHAPLEQFCHENPWRMPPRAMVWTISQNLSHAPWCGRSRPRGLLPGAVGLRFAKAFTNSVMPARHGSLVLTVCAAKATGTNRANGLRRARSWGRGLPCSSVILPRATRSNCCGRWWCTRLVLCRADALPARWAARRKDAPS